jgi:hypothetical protein
MDRKLRDLEQPAPRFGPLHDLRSASSNGAASLSELKEFLGSLQGRSPQEVIGIVSSSLLIQSLGLSAVVVAALLALFTVVPYALYGAPKPKEVASKPAAAAATPTPSADAPPATPAAETGPNAAQAAKALGIDEVKGTKAEDRPPDIDNLLDGIDR